MSGSAWTWTLLSASALALLLAGGLLLSTDPARSPAELAAPIPERGVDARDEAHGTGGRPSAAAALKESPYDIASEMVDAQRRARIWSKESCLSEIRVVTRKGERELVEISHGQAEGRAMPDAPLSPARLTLKYDKKGLPSRTEDTIHRAGRCLPEPNCPLQAAVFAAGQAGADTKQSIGGIYLRSTKYDRPVWTLSAPGQELFHVDGDNCALLRR